MNYEYFLYTWGGFYNKKFYDIHQEREGCHYFDTVKERTEYIKKLEMLSADLDAKELMVITAEGYNTREVTTLHRVITYEGTEYYTNYPIRPCVSYEDAVYILENKWYQGHNDYPLGEDFDYEKVMVKQEWITGAFAY